MILKIKALTMYLLFYLKISKLGKIYLSHEKKYISCFFHNYPLHISSVGKNFIRTYRKNTNIIYNGLDRVPLNPGLKKTEIIRVIN